jgi:hypothetical protein
MYYCTLIISHFTGFWKQPCVNRPEKRVNRQKYHFSGGSAFAAPAAHHCAGTSSARRRRAFRQDFLPSTAFFVDKAAACYYNNVVKMALLCGFAAVQNK